MIGKILLVVIGAGLGALAGLLIAFLGMGNAGIVAGGLAGAILLPLIVLRSRV